jgi:hypothetical protein
MDWIAGTFCHEGSLQGICANIIFVICGFDEAQVNTTLLETIMHHTPAGASTNSFVHFAQEINSSNIFVYIFESRKQKFKNSKIQKFKKLKNILCLNSYAC